jgi:hypothetical protein
MKTLIITLIIGCFASLSYAQDVLIRRNGDEIATKVLEITLSEIKYKRFDNLEGPTFSILKADVFMIKYENGTKETFTQVSRPATAQPSLGVPMAPVQDQLKLAGPRIGFTILSSRYVNHVKNEFETTVNPFITQFGWQFETRIFSLDSGVSGLFEFVPLIGGLEQGKFLPSLSALIGLRGKTGYEFGVGPNISLSGAGLVFAAGANFQSEGVNFPVNIAFAPSAHGSRVSLLFGFNSRRY